MAEGDARAGEYQLEVKPRKGQTGHVTCTYLALSMAKKYVVDCCFEATLKAQKIVLNRILELEIALGRLRERYTFASHTWGVS